MPITKPSSATLPRWATGAVGLAATVEPGSGDKDDGWATGDRPPAGWLNWLGFNIYKWLEWLNDPALLTAGAVTVTGDVTSSGGSVITGSAGHVTVGTGGVLSTGDLETTGGADIISSGFVKTSEADIRHASRVQNLSAYDFVLNSFDSTDASIGTSNGSTQYWEASADSRVVCSLRLEQGQRLTAASVFIKSSSGAAVDFKVYKHDNVGSAPTQLGSTQTSGTSAADEPLTVSGLTETIAANEFVVLEVHFSAANQRVYGGTSTCDRVA